MRLLTAVLVLLVASSHVLATSTSEGSSSTVVTVVTTPATSPAHVDGSTTTNPGGAASTSAGTGTTQSAGTGSTGASVSTVTGGSSTGSTSGAPTTTPTPMKLSTFPVSNGDEPLDAKLILQHAVQLDQQINALNDYLVQAQADTNPTNSSLFAQLNVFTGTLNSQNSTLQGLLRQLQTLTTSQTTLDNRVNNATNTFVCFSQSSCVTDVPTTAEPTSPGPTPSATPCTPTNLTTNADSTPEPYTFNRTQNVDLCSINVRASDSGNNVSITINVTLTGPNSYVTLVEKRTQQNVTITGTTSNYTFQGFQEVDVFYYACPQSTVQFSFDYIEVNNCLLNCTGTNGKCKVSPSGQQYCECNKCEFTGDRCQTEIDPCLAKQIRLCGGSAKPYYGTCVKTDCFDQCYACVCVKDDPDSPQKCSPPTGPFEPIPTPLSYTCPSTSTVAPSTTAALLTTTIIPSGSSPASTVQPVSPTTVGSPATGAPNPPSPSTGGSPKSTEASKITSPAVSTSTVSGSTKV